MSALFPPPVLIVRTIDYWLVRIGRSQAMCRLREQLARFFIRRLSKIVVPQTHGIERIWRGSGYTDDAVSQVIERFVSGGRSDGEPEDEGRMPGVEHEAVGGGAGGSGRPHGLNQNGRAGRP